MTRKPRLWVCREADAYVVYANYKPSRKRDFDGVFWLDPSLCMCADGWGAATGIKLKPGAGPVEITVPRRKRKVER